LLLVDVDEPNRPTVGTVKRTTEVGSGPSKLAVGQVLQSGDGDARRMLAVVSCLDSRQIYVIDLATMEALAVIPNLSGPFDVAIDTERALLFVTDFKTSVLRVLDLAPVIVGSDDSVRVIATVGRPKIVQELQ
jgi:DNA-binding beta-propeller fold protein YncE